MAQLGGIVMMDPEDQAAKKNFFFGGIEGCKFRRPVVPGDTLVSSFKTLCNDIPCTLCLGRACLVWQSCTRTLGLAPPQHDAIGMQLGISCGMVICIMPFPLRLHALS